MYKHKLLGDSYSSLKGRLNKRPPRLSALLPISAPPFSRNFKTPKIILAELQAREVRERNSIVKKIW